MPATAAELNADPHDPAQNVEAGAKYLRDLLLKYEKDPHQVSKAVAAYNAGPGVVDKYQDRKSTRLNSSHTEIYTLSLHDALPISKYLRDLLLKYEKDPHQVSKAVAAYNAGPGVVDKYHGIPPYRETIEYVNRVLKQYEEEQKQKRKSSG